MGVPVDVEDVVGGADDVYDTAFSSRGEEGADTSPKNSVSATVVGEGR